MCLSISIGSVACSRSGHEWEKQADESFFPVFALDDSHVWSTGVGGSVFCFDGKEGDSQQSEASRFSMMLRLQIRIMHGQRITTGGFIALMDRFGFWSMKPAKVGVA